MNELAGPVVPTPSFSSLTTMGVGGTPRVLLAPERRTQLIDTVRAVWESGEDWLLLAGGSNTIVSDDGFDGTVVRVATRGIERIPSASGGEDAGAGPLSSIGGSERGTGGSGRGTGPSDRGAGASERGTNASERGAGGSEPGAGASEPGTNATGRGVARLRVQAGESWDGLVAHTVRNGWSGIEALSGIPGSVGAGPVQNIGAYGQELSDVLVAVEFLDYATGEVRRIPAAELGLGYRTSVLKRGLIGVVLAVELDVTVDEMHLGAALSRPVAYAQLADSLGIPVDAQVPVAELRRAVLRLRASKGMVLDPDDSDSRSAGSFFTNPIVTENFARSLPTDAPRWLTTPEKPDRIAPLTALPASDSINTAIAAEPYAVKLSAAWLIEQCGIRRGYALPGSRAGISSKHTLAIVNRGGATADEIVQLAAFVQSRVAAEFGVILQPEPVLVGLGL